MKVNALLFAGILTGASLIATAEPWQGTTGSPTAPSQRPGSAGTDQGTNRPGMGSSSTAYKEQLNNLVGTWNVTVRVWPSETSGSAETSTPREATGTSTRRWVLDGRILEEDVRCSALGSGRGSGDMNRPGSSGSGMGGSGSGSGTNPGSGTPGTTPRPGGPNAEDDQQPRPTDPGQTPPSGGSGTSGRMGGQSTGSGSAFEGRGMFGFDAKSGEFVHAWADSSDSKIAYSTGDFDQSARTFTFTTIEGKGSAGMHSGGTSGGMGGTSGSGMSDQNRPGAAGGLGNALGGQEPRIVLRIVSNDRHVVEYYGHAAGGAGGETKLMEITYTKSR